MYKSGTRSLKHRVEILDGEVKIGELEAKAIVVSFEGTAEDVKMSMTCTARNNSLMDWYKHRLKVVLIDEEEDYNLGTYLPQYVEDQTDGGETLKSVEAYDLSILAKNDKILERQNFKAGTLYQNAIQGILFSCGITRMVFDPTDAVFQSDRDDWDIGTSKIAIVNQLLSEMSFNNLYIDLNGTAKINKV